MADQNPTQNLLQIVSKLKIFQGLSPRESTLMLKPCVSKTVESSETLYEVGGQSQEMFILLQGRLKVVGKSGTSLGDILPGTCWGEMGVLTGQPRTATVIATQKSIGFTITRQALQIVFRGDQTLHIKVLQNIVNLLSERLTSADAYIENYAGKLNHVDD